MKYPRTNPPRIAALTGLILLSLTGCKYDRSFMNIDSNSGSPFFGLQLAVDSGSRPPKANKESADADLPAPPRRQYPAIPDRSEPAAKFQPPILLTRSTGTGRSGFERTSESRDLNTNVRYSLQSPTTDASLQSKAIDLQLSAF